MADPSLQRGKLAFVGGASEAESSLDAELLSSSDGEVVVLPTGAAYERPERVLGAVTERINALGGRVRPVMVLNRRDAENAAHAKAVEEARCIYLVGGSPLHLRSVLKDSLVFHALVAAWRAGATVAGSSAGAMVLTDPMVDPRGGAFTVGLGLVKDMAVVTHRHREESAQLRRTLALAPLGCAVVVLDEDSAVVREQDGSWRVAGAGDAAVFVDHEPSELALLSSRSSL